MSEDCVKQKNIILVILLKMFVNNDSRQQKCELWMIHAHIAGFQARKETGVRRARCISSLHKSEVLKRGHTTWYLISTSTAGPGFEIRVVTPSYPPTTSEC